ncbi:MAG TPA: haloacid dehalogenase [Chloroflexota bacterium]|nr:haloacid dehalogenase [Chloroflexota bacterium]
MAELEEIVEAIRQNFVAKNAARESALALARETIRTAANAIRAVHRHEFAKAEAMAGDAAASIGAAARTLEDHPDIFHAGFIHDAQKEYAEARLVLAAVRGDALPEPRELGVENAAYLHGLAESVGELRRHLLDYLRRGEVDRCEPLLDRMDEIYTLLVAVDFPDAITAGLRRATDAVRGILERTRGDLTLAFRQRELEARLAELATKLGG